MGAGMNRAACLQVTTDSITPQNVHFLQENHAIYISVLPDAQQYRLWKKVYTGSLFVE